MWHKLFSRVVNMPWVLKKGAKRGLENMFWGAGKKRRKKGGYQEGEKRKFGAKKEKVF